MKKRIFSLLLCIMLCLSLLPMSVFAEESFDFRKLPTTGVTSITVPEGDYYTGIAAINEFAIYWDENIKKAGDFVLIDYFDTDNKGYHLWMMTADPMLGNQDDRFMSLEEVLYCINNPESYDYWINGTYTLAIPITEVTVLNFESPIPGKTTGELSNLQIPEGAHYKFDPDFPNNFSRWFDEESEYGYLQDDVTFTAGKEYQEGAWLVADEGYYFADNCTFKAIGADNTEKELDKMSTFVDEKDITKANIWAEYETAGIPITEVTVLNFESPIPGKTTGELSNLQIPTGAHYKFDPEFPGNFSRWFDEESEYGYLQDDVTFTAGKEYQEGAWLAADEGYYFADNCTFKAIGADNTEKEIDEMSTFVDEYDITKANIWAAYETAVAYTVSFNMNGHGTQVTAQMVGEGEKAVKPADPTVSGWTFGGWYKDSACTETQKYDFNTPVMANLDLYAKWTQSSVTPTDPTSPKTGDNSHMFLWATILFISVVTLVGTAIYDKKKKNRAE